MSRDDIHAFVLNATMPFVLLRENVWVKKKLLIMYFHRVVSINANEKVNKKKQGRIKNFKTYPEPCIERQK